MDLIQAISAVEAAVIAVPATWSAHDGAVVRELNAQLLRIESRLAAVRLAAVRRLDELDVARTEGATSTGALLARGHGGDRAGQERFVRLAQSLTRVGAVETESLLGSADLTAPQAEVIARSLSALPDDVTEADRRRAEKVMLEAAGRLRLPDLRRRGERLADTMRSREEGDAEFDQQLERRERSARERASLRLWDDPDGVVSHGRFTVPKAEADMLRAVLQGFSAPRRKHLKSGQPVVPGLPITPEHRDGVAFTDLLSRIPSDQLPQHGGAASTVAVMIDLAALTGELRRAGSLVGSGTPLSASRSRLIACNANLLPMVLGGASVPLDLGRSQRLYSKAQRLALAVRDGGCTFPDCDRPPAWTEVHHITAWAAGGRTDLKDAAPICPAHHHLVHAQGWELRVRGGQVQYRKPGSSNWLVNERYRSGAAPAVRGPVDADGRFDVAIGGTSACRRADLSITVRLVDVVGDSEDDLESRSSVGIIRGSSGVDRTARAVSAGRAGAVRAAAARHVRDAGLCRPARHPGRGPPHR